MKTANERLAEARAALGFDRKAEFAEYVGIERSTYDKMEKGPHKPSADNLERIAGRCPNINLTWLLTGKGGMFLDSSVASTEGNAKPAQPSIGIDPEVYALVKNENEYLKKENSRLWETLGKSSSSLGAALARLFTSPHGVSMDVAV